MEGIRSEVWGGGGNKNYGVVKNVENITIPHLSAEGVFRDKVKSGKVKSGETRSFGY
jgi:hypothetical protein